MPRISKLSAAVALALASGSALADYSLDTPTYLAAGSTPRVVVRGDFNGDGRPDFATANARSDDVSIYLSQPGGDYATARVPVGSLPGRINVIDVNGDGRQDLVVLNQGDDSVTVLANDGAGAFTKLYTLPTGHGPDRVLTWRSNAGNSRIVVSNGLDGTISYFAFDRSGAPIGDKVVSVGRGPNALANADLDGDGVDELLVVNGVDDTLVVLDREATSAGLPTGVVGTYGIATGSTGISVADLDGDLRPDVAIASQTGGNVAVMLNAGERKLGFPSYYATGRGASGALVVDVDRDGRPDLVVPNSGGTTVSVLRNLGGGAFEGARSYVTSSGPTFPVATDMDGDGIVDIVTSNTSGSVTVLKGMGDGTFAAVSTVALGGAPTNRGAVQVTDVDGDGNLDVVAAMPDADKLAIVGNPQGGFVRLVEYEKAAEGGTHYFMSSIPDERRALDAGAIAGWSRTGQSFRGYKSAGDGRNPVCRLYSPTLDTHFYSPYPEECAAVAADGANWILEAPAAFYIGLSNGGRCNAGFTAIYRLFNGREDVNHRYTSSPASANAMADSGWIVESDASGGALMCAP